MSKSRKHHSRSRSRSRGRARRRDRQDVGAEFDRRLSRLEALISRIPIARGHTSRSRSRSPRYSSSQTSSQANSNLTFRRAPSETPQAPGTTPPPIEEDVLILQDDVLETGPTLDTSVEHPIPDEQNMSVEQSIPDEFLTAIGIGAPPNSSAAIPIPANLLNNWMEVLTNGLGREQREKLAALYLPDTSGDFQAPVLNPEIGTALSITSKTKDTRLLSIQQRLLSVLTAHTLALKHVVSLPAPLAREKELLGATLADMGKIVADCFHYLSLIRRDSLYPFLSKSLKEATANVPPKKFLFGESVLDELKKQKSIESISRELKPSVQSRVQVSSRTVKGGQSSRSAVAPLPTAQTSNAQPRSSLSLNSRGPIRQRGTTRSSGRTRYQAPRQSRQ